MHILIGTRKLPRRVLICFPLSEAPRPASETPRRETPKALCGLRNRSIRKGG